MLVSGNLITGEVIYDDRKRKVWLPAGMKRSGVVLEAIYRFDKGRQRCRRMKQRISRKGRSAT
ncbi:MAG: hypothetical protein ACLUD2_02125 [Clostridium sp.]